MVGCAAWVGALFLLGSVFFVVLAWRTELANIGWVSLLGWDGGSIVLGVCGVCLRWAPGCSALAGDSIKNNYNT